MSESEQHHFQNKRAENVFINEELSHAPYSVSRGPESLVDNGGAANANLGVSDGAL